jgi:hypothetical protein
LGNKKTVKEKKVGGRKKKIIIKNQLFKEQLKVFQPIRIYLDMKILKFS